MKKSVVIGISVILLIGLVFAGYSAYKGLKVQSNAEQLTPNSVSGTGKPNVAVTHKIVMNDEGFDPENLEINQGDRIMFVNEGIRERWPASASHPTHTVYPGSDIDKCGTAEEESIFDSCKGLESGESYSFVFNEIGVWNYHDHLNPNDHGTVTVN